MLVDAIVVARGDARRASLLESLASLSDRGWDLPIRIDKFQIRFSGRSALGDLSLAVISSTRDLNVEIGNYASAFGCFSNSFSFLRPRFFLGSVLLRGYHVNAHLRNLVQTLSGLCRREPG